MDASFLQGFLRAYRAVLRTLAVYGPRAVPDLGGMLRGRLAVLDDELAQFSAAPAELSLDRASQQVETEISSWAEQAWQRQEDNRHEIKEILNSVTTLAESLETRDKAHGREIASMSQRLHKAAQSDDIATIRRSIVESADALTHCVQRMADEGQASLTRLAAEVDGYRSRLQTSELLSGQDPLTGLANRRRFDDQLATAIRTGRQFSLLMIDLNGFKAVNDRYGHLAGDELLRQFADELRAQFPLALTVARWGGDEFAIILNTSLRDTEARVQRLQRWAVGDYTIGRGREAVKISVEAAFGAVEWRSGQTAKELLEQADQELYESKQALRMGLRPA
jgi:diguanylate cyclase (GGDEF)-like protein